MESKAEELRRISNIANGKIPVSEESAVYYIFEERRKLCEAILSDLKEDDLFPHYTDYLDSLERLIKNYLCLK